MSKNIYTQKPVTCPSCQAKFQLKFPNPKFYAATRRDEDQRVREYSWTGGIKTNVQPHHYSVMQCPQCLYTNFREKLERLGHDSKEKEALKAFQGLPKERRMLMQKLHSLTERDPLDSVAALALHLSAIFISLLPGNEKMLDHMKLGRLYLRLSWLYNEIFGDDDSASAESADQKASASLVRKLYKTVEKLENKLQDCHDLLEKAHELAEGRTQELNLTPEQNPFESIIATVEEQVDRSLEQLSRLEHIVAQDQSGILTMKNGQNDDAKEGEQEEMDLGGFVTELAVMWPALPQTEADARKRAVDSFDFSFKNEGVGQDMMQSMVVGGLLIHLLHQVGELDRSLAYCLELYKNAFRDKQSLQMNLNQAQKDDSFSDEEVKEFNRMLSLATATLNKTSEKRRELLNLMFERDKSKIMGLLQAKAAAGPQEQANTLTGAGYPVELVTWLKERQMLGAGDKKKKWFGASR